MAQAEKAFERSLGNGHSEQAALTSKVEQLRAKLVQNNEVIAELMEANVLAKKRTWAAAGGLIAAAPPLNGRWVPHDTRDQIVDYIHHWTDRAELPQKQLLGWLELGSSKFHQWKQRYGKANEHNGQVPRDYWLEDWEREAILEYYDRHPLEGYRRLTFMMLDDDVVAVSPASVYRVLKAAQRLDR